MNTAWLHKMICLECLYVCKSLCCSNGRNHQKKSCSDANGCEFQATSRLDLESLAICASKLLATHMPCLIRIVRGMPGDIGMFRGVHWQSWGFKGGDLLLGKGLGVILSKSYYKLPCAWRFLHSNPQTMLNVTAMCHASRKLVLARNFERNCNPHGLPGVLAYHAMFHCPKYPEELQPPHQLQVCPTEGPREWVCSRPSRTGCLWSLCILLEGASEEYLTYSW